MAVSLEDARPNCSTATWRPSAPALRKNIAHRWPGAMAVGDSEVDRFSVAGFIRRLARQSFVAPLHDLDDGC